jgi:hypothetical protein
MTAVLEKPATAEDRVPINPRLQLPNCAHDVSAFYEEAFAFEDECAKQVESMSTALLAAGKRPLNEFLKKRRAELRADWDDFTMTMSPLFVGLAWKRRAVLLDGGEAHKKLIAEKRRFYEERHAEERDLLDKTVGRSWPARNANPKAYQIQLNHKADEQDWIAVVKAEWVEAVEAERVWKSMCEAVPNYKTCTIHWPRFEPEAAEIADLCGLEWSTPPRPAKYSDRGRRIARDLGFENSPLLFEHELIIEQLAHMLPGELYHPFQSCTAYQLPKVREFVEALPRTPQRDKFLEDTRLGLPKREI